MTPLDGSICVSARKGRKGKSGGVIPKRKSGEVIPRRDNSSPSRSQDSGAVNGEGTLGKVLEEEAGEGKKVGGESEPYGEAVNCNGVKHADRGERVIESFMLIIISLPIQKIDRTVVTKSFIVCALFYRIACVERID